MKPLRCHRRCCLSGVLLFSCVLNRVVSMGDGVDRQRQVQRPCRIRCLFLLYAVWINIHRHGVCFLPYFGATCCAGEDTFLTCRRRRFVPRNLCAVLCSNGCRKIPLCLEYVFLVVGEGGGGGTLSHIIPHRRGGGTLFCGIRSLSSSFRRSGRAAAAAAAIIRLEVH